MILLAIAAGGFLGAASRFFIGTFIKRRFRTYLPLGTLSVNVTGAFLLGVILGMGIEGSAYAFLAIGFLGSFTTYSTLMVEAVSLEKNGERRRALHYLVLSYAVGLTAAFIGLVAGIRL
ncbi:MAG: fluoride efflux transporter FluC [Bacillota bacterium]